MKQVFFILIFSALALAASAQKEVATDTAYIQWQPLTDSTGQFLAVRQTTYTDGSFDTVGEVIGDTAQAVTYLLNQVIDVQRNQANAIQALANSGRDLQALNLYSALLQQVRGRTYSDEVAALYLPNVAGRYRVLVSGQPEFFANLYRLPSGAIRLEREDDTAVRYVVTFRTERSFVVRNLPGASGDNVVALWVTSSNGRPIYTTSTRNVRLIRVGDLPTTAQFRNR